MIFSIMSLAFRVRQALDRLRRHKARRRALVDFRRSLALIVDRDALKASVASRIKEFFDPDILLLLERNGTGEDYRPSYASGLDPDELEDVDLASGGRLANWFRVNEASFLVARDRGVFDFLSPSEQQLLARFHIELGAPLLAHNDLLGILLLGWRRQERRPARRDAELLEQLTDLASLAFLNAALYREQEERLARLHRADRLAAVGQLAAGVAHEVRNPLTSIRSTMQYLSRDLTREDPKWEMITDLIGEVDRINETVSGLLNLSRPSEFRPTEIDLTDLLTETLRLMESHARKQDIQLVERFRREVLRLKADAGQLKQALLNLLLNAVQAMPDGGKITVGTRIDHPPPDEGGQGSVFVDIADTGPGIPEHQLKTVFDPFFTTKSEGTGLGLAICHGIVHQHGGDLLLDSVEGRGTTISIRLPLDPETHGEGREANGRDDGQNSDRRR